MLKICFFNSTVPENVDNEIIGTLNFLEEYKKRYGPNHPNFFTGTLEDAVAESCTKPPRDVRLKPFTCINLSFYF